MYFSLMRVDKYVWCMRLYKTRSLATKAVKEGKISINAKAVKPSKEVEENDVISIKFAPVKRLFKVLDFPKSRVGANLVSTYMIEITPKEDLALLEEINLQKRVNANFGIKGRPTKRDRRDMMKTLGNGS